ncbi:pilus (MSHA type) biogenesis protein MshL [Aliivibrio sp. S2TY2]|uniref:pilus (MSHA type) biogenesis protein MshL n=1 Tax=unclassified Aliivibrio TaxID=2645654 RepID=UPI002378154D|nr:MULTISPECIES: pilus (MSHA type) biogenesis protein MshL [unclassified Aliivibrio]MDD9175577.1 pilus (MSHA type) biogenesis protein MshL [Aliivibrio sp. S3TY1]MDD9192656.1 pilus (MSHA type) biogenesis protein MshL [Aliivibrio sp. S2TY2]
MKVCNVIIGLMVASLTGCSMGHRDPVEIKQTLDKSINDNGSQLLVDLPASVQADLMPELNAKVVEIEEPVKRFRVKANGVNAKAFFTSLVKGTEYSVVIHPAVSGRITMNVNDVTLDEVLSSVEDLYGYEIVKSDKILQVYPATIRTETIPVDYLQLTRKGRSLTTITTGSITNSEGNSSSNNNDNSSSNSNNSSSSSATGGTEIETTSESDFWKELEKAVSVMIGNGSGRSVVVSPQASVVTITASPDELRKVKAFLSTSHKRLQRQVILEAKLLEVTLSDGYQQGINWTNLSASIGGTDISLSQTAGTTAGVLPGMDAIGTLLGGQTNIKISDGNFDAVLSFMDTQGDLNVLSSPRVTAANNQKAVIKVGRDEYYVTEVSSVTGSGDNSNASPEVTLTPFFSGISLDVTPQIDDKGNVMLHVHPSVIDVENEIKEIDLGDVGGVLQLPLAKSSIRESDSVIRAKSGDVVVIGGLMKSQTVDQVSKVPFLGDIPALGHLFRNVSKLTQKTELVILLKPTVVGVDTWQEELERSRDLLQEWFPDE